MVMVYFVFVFAQDSLKLDTELSQIKTNEEETVLKQVKPEACDPGCELQSYQLHTDGQIFFYFLVN
jgi:hypothetical protein